MSATRLVSTIAVAAMLVPASSAAADTTVEFEHSAPVPCSVLCPYWINFFGEDECSATLPPGSFDETVLAFTEQRGVVEVAAFPLVDYDIVVCTDTEPRRVVISLGNPIGEPCNVAGTPSGCAEHGGFRYANLMAANGGANDRFVVRSYNFSDVASVPVELHGPIEIVDDSFEASVL